jgi:hypothetical protein
MAVVPESRHADLALRRRTPVLRALASLVCWLLEIPSLDDVDQAALEAHIAALAERDVRAARLSGQPGTEALDRPLDL